jgi:hypothetical protein
LFVTTQQDSEGPAPFRGNAAGILACEYEAKLSIFEAVKIISKRVLTKKMNVF